MALFYLTEVNPYINRFLESIFEKMGNSGSNSTSQRRRRNSSSRRNSLKGIDSNVEKFFTVNENFHKQIQFI